MKKLSEVTRRDLFDMIQEGFSITEVEQRYDADFRDYYVDVSHKVYMLFCGRANELEFLSRLYNLEDMPSTDSRYKNAKGDIRCHTVSFNDWPQFWFLDDSRFELIDGNDDEPLLRFLCEMLHPAVRDEESPWRMYLKRFNELIKADGYEIYATYRISGRDVYKAREINEDKSLFDMSHLFTARYKNLIYVEQEPPIDNICNSIDLQTKERLGSVMLEFSEPAKIKPNRYDPWEITTDAFVLAVRRLNRNCGGQIINITGNFADEINESQLSQCFTPYLFDLIELQYDELSKGEQQSFQQEINTALLCGNTRFTLTDAGVMERRIDYQVLDHEIQISVENVSETGLKGLLDEAIALHMQSSFSAHRDAVEKIWDALERLKTYYTAMDKRVSASKIVHDMAGGQDMFDVLFTNEFKALTDIGNNFRIRHHETNRTDITDDRHYDYFFNRCLSLIALAIQYLK